MRKLLVAALTTAAFAIPARAEIVTYDFAAVAGFGFGDSADGTVVDAANAFDTLTGQIVFDTTPSDPVIGFPDPEAAFFGPGLISFDQFDIGTFDLSDRQLVISNDSSGADVVSLVAPGISTADIVTQVNLIMTDFTGTALSTAELPDMLSLDDFAGASLFFNYIDNVAGGAEFARYDLSELTLAPIPLPAGGLLLLGALAGLGLTRRRG